MTRPSPSRETLRRQQTLAAAVEPCVLILGDRGSGKTIGLEHEYLRIAKEGRYALVVFDLKGDSARRSIGHLCAKGLEARAYLEIAADVSRTLPWPFFRQPTERETLRRQIAMNLEVQRFLQSFWSIRDIKRGTNLPYTKAWAETPIRLWGNCEPLPPLGWILKFFDIAAPERAWMLRHSADREAVREVELLDRRTARSPIQFEREAGASKRLLDCLKSPVLWTRHGTKNVWPELLPGKAQVYIDLSGVSHEEQRLLAIFVSNAVIAECWAHFHETHTPLPVVIVLEEAGYLDLVTPEIIAVLQGGRAAGISIWIVSQTKDDFDPVVFEQSMGLTRVHRNYRMNSGIERAASDLATPTFNPMEVHYTRQRLVQDGVEPIATKSTGTSSDERGHVRSDERQGVSFITRYRTVVDEFYKTPQIHEQEFRTALATLRVGQRFTRDLDGVRKESLTPLEEPWPLGLTEIRTAKAIARIRSRQLYQTPDINQPTVAERPKPLFSEVSISQPQRKKKGAV